MPRGKKSDQAALPGMPTMADLRDTLWKAADKLRGSMDAAQYKDFVLGLVFLKYVSDSFEERRARIREEVLADNVPESRIDQFLDDKDEYTREGVFWVPVEARWDQLAASAKSAGIGELLDNAMDAVMKTNSSLTGVLPKIFNRDNVDQRRLGELVDLISDARFTGHGDKPARDVLGEVYEYFLEKFARAEGKRGGEFYTPATVVRLLVEVLEPYSGRVYDPCCGSGGMFVQAEKFVLAHRGRRDAIAVYGQESNERTWRLAKMNLAIHGINGNLSSKWEDTFREDRHPDRKADFILANPPFNMSDWARRTDDPRWRFGVPPSGNANFAWLQHIISKLAERGSAGVVLANGSMSSQQSGEGQIRAAMVEADLVACMIALPPQLFRTTAIPACLWFLTKDKTPQGEKRLTERRGEVLFIDARPMGFLVNRTERELAPEEIVRVASTYHAWRGTASAREARLEYEDIPGFCYSAPIEEIRKHDHVLTPGRYVGAAEVDDGDDEPITREDRAPEKRALRAFRRFRTAWSRKSVPSWSASMSERRTTTFRELVATGTLEIGDGYRAKLEELGGTGPIFLRAGLLSDHGIDWTRAERFREELAQQVNSKLGRAGDTVITTKGNSVGRAGYIPENAPSFVYSPHLSYWRSLDPSQISTGFLRYWSDPRNSWPNSRPWPAVPIWLHTLVSSTSVACRFRFQASASKRLLPQYSGRSTTRSRSTTGSAPSSAN